MVGAGPAGLLAAATLARYGVRVALLERRLEGSELPRATVSSTRTMEVLRWLGVSEQVRDRSDAVSMTMLMTHTAADAAAGVTLDVGFPSAEQAAIVSPEGPLCVAQDQLEAALLQHLAQRQEVSIRRGWQVSEVVEHADHVLVVGRDVRTNQALSIRGDWVLAADGVRSAVRQSLGVEMVGPADAMSATQLEVRAPIWDLVGDNRHLIYAITHPEGAGALLPAGLGDRWIYALDHGADRTPPTLQETVDRLRIASGSKDLPVVALRHRHTRIGAQIAASFGRDRVFLTGDAAHRVTPRGGTGLNTAMASAFNIAWKLAWVVHGWSSTDLLASYEAERRVIAEHNRLRSLDPQGSLRSASEALVADLGGRIRHLWLRHHRMASTLDLLGPGATMFVGPDASTTSRATRPDLGGPVPAPVTVVELDPLAAQAFGVGAAGSILVRPDGVPLPLPPTTTQMEEGHGILAEHPLRTVDAR
ncbi:2-polyprenyl-6-methoxyphenol hydroxylase [Micromonospora auratinigra]|uniref:2-polyprenyl-6-methoxyphenol hydroxylase n=1 Tax=Micromonospora auratinigra TaxID=261654 RepID=A0A1A8Z4I6_9ACTN|nr:2-polyprenyl-6-methoxyphenol hydroxylase [Micromonospora auratinigra]